MQGRIEQTDAHRLTLHDAEKLNEIIALHWQQAF
ncbi:glycyl-tRNA synthetase beta subunit [Sulfitobacter sp. EE-36]|nr:glycyl-tRNA synthetase beta subunit [Sulfitobacter sp. EE-36]